MLTEQFQQDVAKGLSQNPKALPSKYFYDPIGDQLFVKIMNMPEYYLTDAELEIFSQQTQSLITSFDLSTDEHFELIELGAGDGTKTEHLLSALQSANYQFDYIPIDISQHALDVLHARLGEQQPGVSVRPRQGDYFHILESLKKSNHPKVLLFMGSNIGNQTDEMAISFVQRLSANLAAGDQLLIGVDLIKSADIVLPAYNDSAGITRDFNLNLLRRINRELGADFNLEKFEHVAEYSEESGMARSFLQSRTRQSVTVSALKQQFEFAEGEKIHTEISRKYNDQVMSDIITGSDFKVIKRFTDQRNYFADYLLKHQ